MWVVGWKENRMIWLTCAQDSRGWLLPAASRKRMPLLPQLSSSGILIAGLGNRCEIRLSYCIECVWTLEKMIILWFRMFWYCGLFQFDFHTRLWLLISFGIGTDTLVHCIVWIMLIISVCLTASVPHNKFASLVWLNVYSIKNALQRTVFYAITHVAETLRPNCFGMSIKIHHSLP